MSEQVVIIGHRGVPGQRLEHTRASYELAIEQGADYIEPDVVATSDGVLVVRHENEVSHSTDVASRPEFAERRTTKPIDGTSVTGWFTEDFTLDELKSLRCRERLTTLRPQNLPLDDSTEILTFDEAVEIARAAEREVGVYVETKHPSYFAGLGLDLNSRLVEAVLRLGIDGPQSDVPLVVQSMETANLRQLSAQLAAPLVQLLSDDGAPADLVALGDRRTYADLASAPGLAEIAEYAYGIGPNKNLVIGRDDDGRFAGDTGLVELAHAAGLVVHPWTMRNENKYLPLELRSGVEPATPGDAEAEYRAFFEAGVDGVFSDYTATAVAALERWRLGSGGLGSGG